MRLLLPRCEPSLDGALADASSDALLESGNVLFQAVHRPLGEQQFEQLASSSPRFRRLGILHFSRQSCDQTTVGQMGKHEPESYVRS